MFRCVSLLLLSCAGGAGAKNTEPATGPPSTTVLATDARFVTALGRPYAPAGGGAGLGCSWLGCGVRVSHTGRALRATYAATASFFKVAAAQSDEGYMPWQGQLLVPASDNNETVAVAHGAGVVDIMLSLPPQYFDGGAGAAVLLSLTSDGGGFKPAPEAPARVFHILGDSITAATNIHGGVAAGCADEGFQSDGAASWAGIICGFFGASCSTVAVGGKCLIDACGGTQMPEYYRKARYTDAGDTFAFKDAPPVAFFSYLGTNDYHGRNGTAVDQEFADAYLTLFANVTQNYYPLDNNVTFFLLLGPMSPTLPRNATQAAVERGTAAGFRVVLIDATEACHLLPGQTGGCTDGCATHPGVASHRNIARTVAPIVAQTLGWPMPGAL